jgi:hypothetical protein
MTDEQIGLSLHLLQESSNGRFSINGPIFRSKCNKVIPPLRLQSQHQFRHPKWSSLSSKYNQVCKVLFLYFQGTVPSIRPTINVTYAPTIRICVRYASRHWTLMACSGHGDRTVRYALWAMHTFTDEGRSLRCD